MICRANNEKKQITYQLTHKRNAFALRL